MADEVEIRTVVARSNSSSYFYTSSGVVSRQKLPDNGPSGYQTGLVGKEAYKRGGVSWVFRKELTEVLLRGVCAKSS
ncbi:hypothetical protein M0802_000419 [Mischocyttarus mexicanus]|nr:hypothetical protein M0802_000419 [Mischocyttarus mexicanus]